MDNKVIETEVVPEKSLVVRQSSEIGLFGTQDPSQVIGKAKVVAQALKDVIVKQGLVSRIQGKEYPRCEAWTLLGTMLGVFPVLCWSRPVKEGWEARVEARTKDGSVIGAAEAECLRSERNWKDRDEFALRSMAQTRATAKCLRMPLGFVMSLSGFEVTPAEEMVADHPHKEVQPESPVPMPEPPKPAPFPTEASRKKMIDALKANPDEPNRDIVDEYFRKLDNPSALLPNEQLEDLPLRFVPATKGQMNALANQIAAFGNGERAAWPYPPHDEPTKAPAPKEEQPKLQADWRSFPMPFGKHAGKKLGDLERKYLFGLWANYTVETEYNGKPKNPEMITKDQRLRDMLDLAGIEEKFTKKEKQ